MAIAEQYSVEAYLKATGADKFSKAFDNAAKNVEGLEKTTSGANLTIGKLLGTLAGVAATIGIFRTLRNSVDRAFARIDTMEQFERVMTTLTGSSEKANDVLGKVNETVKGTAYGLDVGARAVQGFVTSAMDVDVATQTLGAWADAVAFYGDGTNETLDRVTTALAQATAKGKIQMDTMNRLAEAGIPAMQIFADATNQSVEEVAEMMSKGEISAEMFHETMNLAMTEGTTNFKSIEGAAREAGASWTGSFDNMRAAVTRGVMSIVQSIDDMLTSNGLPDMRAMVALFGRTFEQVLNRIAEGIPTIVDYIKQIKSNLEPWIPLITQILIAIGGFVATFATFNTLKRLIDGVKMSVALFNATLLANPIGLILGLIGALVGVLIYLWNTNETVREALTTAWNYIKETAISVWESIKAFIMPVVDEIVSFVMDIWSSLVAFWDEHGQMILQAAQNVWSVISNVISTVMNVIWGIMQRLWPIIKALVITTWNAIKGAIQGAINVITGIIRLFAALFTGNWSEMWAAVKQILSGAVQFLINFIQVSLVGRALRIGRSLLTGFTNIMRNLWTRVKSIFSNGINSAYRTVTGFFTKFKNAGKNIVTSIADGIKGAIGKVIDAISGVVGKVRDFLPFSPPKTGPLKDIMNVEIAESIAHAINKGRNVAVKAMENLSSAINGEMPQVNIAGRVANSNASINSRIDHQMNYANSNIENLLRDALSRQQVIVLDTGELVGATTDQYNQSLGDNYKSKRRWSL